MLPIVFIKGVVDRLVKDFRLVIGGVVVSQVPGAQCAAVAWQDSGVVDAGGKGSYRVGEVIFGANAGVPPVSYGVAI